MRPLRWPSLTFRILVWCGTAYGANYVTAIGRGNITGPADTSTALFGPRVIWGTAFFLVLTVLPGLLYVLLIRTWAGSVVVGAAFATLVIATMRSIANSMSSRSGGLWGAVRARSEHELTTRWPELLIVRDRPAGLSDEHLAYLYDHELHDIDDSPWGILDVVAAERHSRPSTGGHP